MKYIVLFCIGILSVSWCPHLPGPAQVAGLLIAALAALGMSCIWRRRKYLTVALLLLGAALAGAGWGSAAARVLVASQIPAGWQGQSLYIEGVISGLPALEAGRWQFEFEARSARRAAGGPPVDPHSFPRRLRLSWYYGPEVQAGQAWQLEVRLKPPRGLVNPGGFDYQRWLLSRGIAATGYVRESAFNRQTSSGSITVDRVRETLREHLIGAVPDPALHGYLLALLLGDNASVDARGWSLLQDFGLNHLLSISGLHISLSAAIGYVLFSYLARGLAVLYPVRQLVPLLPLSGALALATGYCLLAGFTLPSQRSLVMVAVVLICRCLYRDTSPWVGLGWALLCCVLLDPLAGYDSGFWLSFGAVAVLLLGIHGSGARCPAWLQLLRVQGFIFVGLLIPLLLLGLPLSVLAPLANLLMVPLVSVAVVPPLLAGVIALPLWPTLSALVWQAAGWVLDLSLQVLEYGRDFAAVIYLRPDLPLALLAAATVAVIPWLLPGLRSLRGLSLPALAALLWWGSNPPPDDALVVTVLDVGQGLAVLIRQGERALLYDTGPAMGPTLSAGSAVIVPFLRRQGVQELEYLVVSHNDVDHRGGLADILDVVPAGNLLAGEPEKLSGTAGVRGCDSARQWQWPGADPVRFDLLAQEQPAHKGNNRSCVLLVEVNGWRLLVPGDIEAAREAELLAHPRLAAGVDTLIAPHHGSRTSSTEAFLDRLQPRRVVVSSGFRNRFNHPHPLIVQRYRVRGAEVLNTAETGAVTLALVAGSTAPVVTLTRHNNRRYWYELAK